jgi:hypothetical protein
MAKKRTYRIKNWAEYNKSLIQRGDITLWYKEHHGHCHRFIRIKSLWGRGMESASTWKEQTTNMEKNPFGHLWSLTRSCIVTVK